MGTELMNYAILGVKLPYPEMADDNEDAQEKCEEYFDSAYNTDIEGKNGINVIFDGMNGQYVFAGQILEKWNESSGGLEPTDFERVYDFYSLRESIAAALDLAFGPNGSISVLSKKEITVDDISLWVFSHWH